jgi:hypothetical protein
MVVTRGLADLTRNGPLCPLERMDSDHCGEQRRAHHLTAAGALPFLQCRKDSEGAVHACEQIGDRHADALWVG